MNTQIAERLASIASAHTDLLRGITERLNEIDARLPGGASRPRDTGGFVSGGEFLRAVRGLKVEHRNDPRLIENSIATFGGWTVGGDGGFALPPDFKRSVLEPVIGSGSILGVFDPAEAHSGLVQVGVDETAEWSESGVTAAIVAEGGAITASKPAVQRRNVVIHAIKTLTHASEEILRDNPAYAEFLFRQQGRKIANRVERLIIAGTGASEPMGLLASPALVTVAKESGQTAATIVSANVRKMLARLLPGSYRSAVWITHTTALPEVMGLGAGIYNPDGVSPFGLGTVLGRPLAVSEWANPLGSVGDLILVDPAGYLFAVEGPRNDVALGFAFDQGLSSFRVVLGMGGVPLLSAPVPRRTGTDTLSHVVVLAERS